MKLLVLLFLLGLSATVRADTPIEHWDRIPGVSSLEMTGDKAVTLRAEHRLTHMLANGAEHVNYGHIDGTTGQWISTPEQALHVTITTGESVIIGGAIRPTPRYKLVRIENQVCIFEYIAFGGHGEVGKLIAVSPYPPKA